MKTRVFAVCVVVFLFCGITHAGLSDGLVAYYPFNGNANDESGNGNNGVVHGATLTYDRNGNANRAYSFDGINSYIDVGNPIGDNPSIITQCAWILVLSPNGTIITKRQADDGSDWASMDVLSDYSVRFWLDDKNYNNNSSWALSAQYSDQQWHFICGVRNGSSLKLYVDGNTSAATSDSHVMSGSTYNMYIGYGAASARHFTGKIDDVRIYNRAISDSEVQQLYQGQGTCSNDIVTFTAGTPAKAAEVNANFDLLRCQMQAMKAAFCQEHPTASMCQ
jgi:hypothetical protein